MINRRFSISAKFIFAVVFITVYLGEDLVLKETTPLVHASVRALVAIITAGAVYYIIGTDKIRNFHVTFTRSTRIWCVILGLAFLIIYMNLPGQIMNLMESSTVVADILMAFSAGMCEEFIFRGLLLSACLEIFSRSNLKYTLTACLSALFFGMFHFVNALHQPIGATIQQVIYACVLGMLLAAVRISTNTMGWVVLLHWLYDASAGLSVNTSATGTGLWAPFLIFWGLLLLVALLFMISYDHSTNRISLSRDYISRS